MKLLKSVWQDIDIYITILFAIVVAMLGLFQQVDQSIIFSVTLGTLALLSYSLLQDRKAREKLLKGLDDTVIELSLKELQDYKAQQFALESANYAFFWGITFDRLLREMSSDILPRLESGQLHAKILLLEPNSDSVRMAAFRNPIDNDPNLINAQLETVIRKLKNFASQAKGPENLEVRVVNYLPPWTVVGFDPHSRTGKMFVSLLPFKQTDRTRPYLQLHNNKDSIWIERIHNQFDLLWEESKPINLFQET